MTARQQQSVRALLATRDGATGRYFFGAGFDTMASALWLATLTWVASGAHSALLAGLVMFAGVVPGVVAAASIAGGLVDDHGADWVIAVTMTLRCVFMLAWVGLAHWVSSGPGLLVGAAVIAFVFDGLTGLHGPAVSAYTADLVPSGMQLLARLASSTAIRLAQLVGMGAGAWLVTQVRVTSTAATAFVCLVISWMLYRSVRRRLAQAPGQRITGGRGKASIKDTLKRSVGGWHVLGRDEALRRSVILQATVSIGTAAAVTAGLPLRVRSGHLPDSTFAWGIGLYLLGILVASGAALMVASQIQRPVRIGLTTGLVAGVAVVAVGAAGSRPMLFIGLLAAGLAMGGVGPMLSGYRAQRTMEMSEELGESVVGRVEAAVTVLQLIEPIGYPLMGLLVASLGVRPATVVVGAFMVLAGAYGLSSSAAREASRAEVLS